MQIQFASVVTRKCMELAYAKQFLNSKIKFLLGFKYGKFILIQKRNKTLLSI